MRRTRGRPLPRHELAPERALGFGYALGDRIRGRAILFNQPLRIRAREGSADGITLTTAVAVPPSASPSNGTTITIPVGSSSASSDPVSVDVRSDEAYKQGDGTVTVSISGTSGGNYEALDTTDTASTTAKGNISAGCLPMATPSSATAAAAATTAIATVRVNRRMRATNGGVPEGRTVVVDRVRGEVEFENSTIEDFVLLRGNGSPMFLLANVVDDLSMGITHVVRAEEHLPNTPKQQMIWRGLGHEPPVWAHVPVLVNDRPDVAALARTGGVHVGQDDLKPMDARRVVGAAAHVGLSTHTHEQIDAAVWEPVSYIAVGPVFGTHTKLTGHNPVGLELVQLAAAAAVTNTIRFGTNVCLVPQRNPIHLAKEVATLDRISGGRVEIGMGAGWNEHEHRTQTRLPARSVR